MPINRFFFSSSMHPGAIIVLDPNESHHAYHVVKAKVGEEIELINGLGDLAIARVVKFHKKQIHLEVLQSSHKERDALHIALVQAICPLHKLEWIVEKSTELGVGEIFFYRSSGSGKRELYPSNLEQLEKKAIAAIKQSGRLFLPKIHILNCIEDFPTVDFDSCYLLDHRGKKDAFSSSCKNHRIALAVGPESGWSEQERSKFTNFGFSQMCIMESTLRTETAAIFAVGLCRYHLELKTS